MVSIVMMIVNGTITNDIASTVVSAIIAVLIFWIANNIKREAGK